MLYSNQSCLYVITIIPQEYFSHETRLYQSDVDATTSSVRQQLESIVQKLHRIFSSLLRHSDGPKLMVIKWLVRCFKANSDRGKVSKTWFFAHILYLFFQMLSRLEGMNIGRTTASDGFFLNLSWVMLLLSAPFAKSTGGVNPRLMGVDPGYCSLKGEDNDDRYGGALVDFSQEAKMASSSTGNKHIIVMVSGRSLL